MLPTRTPRHGAALLFLSLSIAACASNPPREPAVEVRTVTVRVPTPVAVDPALTFVEPEPVTPAGACMDAGQRVLCNAELADDRDAWKLHARRLAERLRAIARLSPGPVP